MEARALSDFPGELPDDLESAYRIQDAAIARFPDRVVGWKVGYVAPERRDASGDERIVGPVFAGGLWMASDSTAFPVFVGGFAAVEAEYVARLAFDAPPEKLHWSADEAAELTAALHTGIETAGSPLASINVIGPRAVVPDFGNNAGLILGPEIEGWRTRALTSMACDCAIDDRIVGRGGAMTLSGGPMGALAFALARNARRGRPLRAGDLVTTGAATGIHDIVAGQSAWVDFGIDGRLHCHAVARTPAEG
nr:2-keto-4-pentenoate hydratase [Chiayiivirga flava]